MLWSNLVKAMVFPVVMYGCESWTTKEGWTSKNWCFWTVVLEKTLESPLDRKEIQPVNPKYSLEGLMLKLQYFGHLMRELTHLKRSCYWERLRAGGKGDERMRWLDGITDSVDVTDGEGQGSLACCSPWGRKDLNTTEWLNNNTGGMKRKTTEVGELKNYLLWQRCSILKAGRGSRAGGRA